MEMEEKEYIKENIKMIKKYLKELSKLDFLTESFILMPGRDNVPFLSLSYKRSTPVVVSSEIPRMPANNSG